MLIDFFFTLRAAKLPVSVKEYLIAARGPEAGRDRTCERHRRVDRRLLLPRAHRARQGRAHFDKFDRAFGAYFNGASRRSTDCTGDAARLAAEEARARAHARGEGAVEALGWDELMKTLKKRLEEQKERHEGGSKWIGTGGTSPFGHGGYNPQGIRIGGARAATAARSRSGSSAPTATTTTSSSSARATSRSRCAACAASRAKAPTEELDLDDTIQRDRAERRLARHQDGPRAPQQGEGAAADGRRRHDGRPHPPRRGAVLAPPRPSSSTSSSIYFHNCVYDFVWKNNRRRSRREARRPGTSSASTTRTTKLIFVGDATMSPYEILQPGGSVEYNNEEAGADWLQRLTHALPEVRLDQPRAARRVAVPAEHLGDPAAHEASACCRSRSKGSSAGCGCCRSRRPHGDVARTPRRRGTIRRTRDAASVAVMMAEAPAQARRDARADPFARRIQQGSDTGTHGPAASSSAHRRRIGSPSPSESRRTPWTNRRTPRRRRLRRVSDCIRSSRRRRSPSSCCRPSA